MAIAKEIYPGKRNSLDALCDRLGVDNSGRTLHGALLDTQLLADVYINMTRGQGLLLIDADVEHSLEGGFVGIDLSAFDLPILLADSFEIEAHVAALHQIDLACGGKALWLAGA